MAVKTGNYTYLLENTPSVLSFGAVGSKKESEGPLGQYFDVINPDSSFGESSWEKAESKMVQISVGQALSKGNFEADQIDMAFAGDLLNQCIGSVYGLRDLGIPFVGLYGACSTMGGVAGAGSFVCRYVHCQKSAGSDLFSFLLGRTAVSFPAGIRRPATAYCSVDRYRLWRLRGRRVGRCAFCAGGDAWLY